MAKHNKVIESFIVSSLICSDDQLPMGYTPPEEAHHSSEWSSIFTESIGCRDNHEGHCSHIYIFSRVLATPMGIREQE
jgi:hypothetical protein